MQKIVSEHKEIGVILLKKVVFALLLALALTGCYPQRTTDVASHIVTEITITCETCTDFTRRYYNTHEKMQKFLLYLRSVSPGFTPDEDPEPLAGRVICITLWKADGTTKIYRQKNDRYLQEGTGPWKKIRQEWGASLYQLLLENESDEELGRGIPSPPPGSWRYREFVRQATRTGK